MTAQEAIALLQDIAQLEPIAVGLVSEFINGLKGKTDAEILAADSSLLTSIVATAHANATGAAPAQN